MRKHLFFTAIIFVCSSAALTAQKITIDLNNPERSAWFSDLGFGMLFTWSVDVQLPGLISDNVAESSSEYQNNYFTELPKSFNPKDFDPEQWAVSAKLAGVKYVIFTAKHHNGFCMWDTQASDFNIMNSGYGKDILKEMIDAFRKQGLAVGLSFSPNDYYFLSKQGFTPNRYSDESESTKNSELWETNKKQLKELLSNYGKIDILSIEDGRDWVNPLVANFAWDLDPDLIITRGGMETFEYKLPEETVKSPWEAVVTMGFNRHFDPAEKYKDAGALINMLIETRAKGGNFLLNISPDASGKIPQAQEAILSEIGLWMISNNEAIVNVKPWIIPNEQDIWFTASKNDKVVYAFVNASYWNWLESKAFFIQSIKGSSDLKISVLGQNNKTDSTPGQNSPNPFYSETGNGIFINVLKTQRISKTRYNPTVLKFEGVSFRENFRK